MAIPGVTNFANLGGGNQPAALLDSSFDAVQTYADNGDEATLQAAQVYAEQVSGKQYLHVRETQASGVASVDVAATGVNIQRTLNTILSNDITSASVSSNVISLPAGVYDVNISVPGSSGGGTWQARLWDNSNSVALLVGTPGGRSAAPQGPTGYSLIKGRITLTNPTDLIIQHRFATAASSCGVAANVGYGEVYTDVHIYKIG